MAEYLTNTADLTAVADAIRAKGGTAAQLVYPSGFVSAIQAIQTVTISCAQTGDGPAGCFSLTIAISSFMQHFHPFLAENFA